MPDTSNRRPLASRQTGWAVRTSRWLAGTRVTPNQISMAGMAAALIAGACFWAAGSADGAGRVFLLLLAALFVQGRLLCNLFDGMVAIEAGRASPDGAFWNEFPDRVSDMLILVGAGLSVADPALGWAAAAFAFLTAYVRELGVNTGAGADFAGPMAKQHRMAVMTGAAILAIFEPIWSGQGQVLRAALWIVAIGAALTAARRGWRQVERLRSGRN
ncbi:CDP-alcohol phosphatidyltransferase family protein [Paracoccus caeni]|uniref:CDP-alcohol phosphatidyltransferase family protein n=2 Tax=Paracoccus caeni TaxID=657651 RepID=A0A934W020_9RHOB|nr:CDP-alcohol phosphatidyltransferase family protein [Paracoccus caeni]